MVLTEARKLRDYTVIFHGHFSIERQAPKNTGGKHSACQFDINVGSGTEIPGRPKPMEKKMVVKFLRTVFFLFASFLSSTLFGNDGASSGPAGGLVLQKQENISINKEVLTVSFYNVTVEYDFENNSDNDIKTYVQFPLPAINVEYQYNSDPGNIDRISKTFELLVDGKKKDFKTDFKVFGTKDSTDLKSELTKLKIKFDEENEEKLGQQIEKLSDKHKKRLLDIGLLKRGDRGPKDQELLAWQKKHLNKKELLIAENAVGLRPAWSFQKIFYWEQTFPAHKVLKVTHSYVPYKGVQVGASYVYENACVDEPTRKGIEKSSAKGNSAEWVDYILTTANTWSGPIKDFKLIIKKESDIKSKDFIVSTCFPGVKKVSDKQFESQITNFVPDKELSIYFFK